MKYRLCFDIHGFWQAGSGRGAGPGADSLVVRTPGGLPYLPGKAVKGLVRDAVRTAEALGHVRAPNGSRTIELFGGDNADADGAAGRNDFGAQPGRLRFSDARLGRTDTEARQWEAWAVANREKRAFLYPSIASTAIDDDGLARKRSLRTSEVTVPCRLFAAVEGEGADWADDLRRALPLVRAVGGKRTRGFGRCTVTLVEG